jgi:hypothetical protein
MIQEKMNYLGLSFLSILAFLSAVSSWSVPVLISQRQLSKLYPKHQQKPFGIPSLLTLSATESNVDRPSVILEAIASSGLEETELSVVLEAVEAAFTDGIGLVVTCDTTNLVSMKSPCPTSLTGALGRVLLLKTNLAEESIEVIQYATAEQMDQLIYAGDDKASLLTQPVLISIQNVAQVSPVDEETVERVLASIVEQEVEQYEMVNPLPDSYKNKPKKDDAAFLPSLHVEIDGANMTDEFHSTTFWDTSSVLVFDDIVDEDLRRRLLDVTLGRASSQQQRQEEWDDTTNGPNPNRWERGGLLDNPDDDDRTEEEEEPHSKTGTCWGLPVEAIEEICFQHHDAIEEFESILSQLFPQFVVTRLPEGVFGSGVSPLTANAPTTGDIFNYHIDGDPNLTPPSPWTDVYGRYPNRSRGQPRFMSCLLYLNDEWNDDWGAPTRFLDLPTDQYYEVRPRPGRCVFMDQDISHTVVAPSQSAGKRPRYSLVWKLILHPKTINQDMMNLAGDRAWPDPVLFGSAEQEEIED